MTPLLEMQLSQHKSKFSEHVCLFVLLTNIIFFFKVLFYVMISLINYFWYNSGKKMLTTKGYRFCIMYNAKCERYLKNIGLFHVVRIGHTNTDKHTSQYLSGDDDPRPIPFTCRLES
jgi:hypothetical protein